MAWWLAGYDPLLGLAGAQAGAGPFYDPLWAPGLTGATRRRLNAPAGGSFDGRGLLEQGGAGGEAKGGGEGGGGGGGGGEGEQGAQEGQRGREPFVLGSAGWTSSIPCDFIERESEYVLRADIPGCKKAEIHVDVHGPSDAPVIKIGLMADAERAKDDAEEEGIFHRAERISTFRNRNLRLPEDADAAAIQDATYEDGVLQAIIPKKAEGRREGRVVEIL